MPDQATFTLTCPQCGHASHFDKRLTCTAGHPVLRASIINLILGNVGSGSVVGKGDLDADNIAGDDIHAAYRAQYPKYVAAEGVDLTAAATDKLHELTLACTECGCEMFTLVDCEDYV
jgi:hypothetical protein